MTTIKITVGSDVLEISTDGSETFYSEIVCFYELQEKKLAAAPEAPKIGGQETYLEA